MEAMVFASALIKNRYSYRAEEAETFYSGRGHGLKDVARVAVVLGGILLYAGLLAFGA